MDQSIEFSVIASLVALGVRYQQMALALAEAAMLQFHDRFRR